MRETASSRALLDTQIHSALLRTTKKATLEISEWCFVAVTCTAWSGYHHQLYQLQLSGFRCMTSEKFEAGKEVLRRAIAHDWDAGLFKQFDSRLCVSFDAVTFHMRSDAHSERCAYLFVWNQLTRYDELRAALLAALLTLQWCANATI